MSHSIRVVMTIGEMTYPRCEVDEFTPGELTVTSSDDGSIVRTFPAGSWLHATAYTGRRNVAYSFESDAYKTQMAALIKQHEVA